MLQRDMAATLEQLFGQYPVVTLTGPRQSGKTTLARMCFSELPYFNLEALDTREFAETDPRGFLARAPGGAIFDEIQRVPALLGFIQEIVDARQQHGMFLLTGSQQLSISEAISQSLAGRTGLLTLLPLTIAEADSSGRQLDTDERIYTGFYPRIFNEGIEPTQAYGDYTDTYVERDVRQLSNIRDLSTFRRFVKLCAGRTGQLLNLSQLASDTGISHSTAREWMSVLEASYLVHLLPPYHANISKRLVKSPKLYFHDVGLACYLIGIESPSQIATHPLRGPLFENLVVSELLKRRYNIGRRSNLYFYCDSKGFEVDVVLAGGDGLTAIEIKAGKTLATEQFRALGKFADQVKEPVLHKYLVYDGDDSPVRQGVNVTTPTNLVRDLDAAQ